MARTIQQLFDLKGQTALVTGGSRGLGLQMAHALGEAGAKVIVSSRKAEDLMQAVAELKLPVLMQIGSLLIAARRLIFAPWPKKASSAWGTLVFWSTMPARLGVPLLKITPSRLGTKS
jgi:NAD(P)-dependent dehydrogenase (short-subunit alcohol dehydrogenase family)